MNKTIKLYYEDAYIRHFDATILSIEKAKDNLYKVILDRSAFFPESGGQSADRGTIAGAAVCDVHIKDDVIIHSVLFEGDPSSLISSKVPCSLDFDQRFSNMQQHTGEHIFSGIVKKNYGYENVGFHLSNNIVTMDYDGKLSDEDIARLEKLSNEAIFSNVSVTSGFPDAEELAELDYRSKLEASEMGDVRIVNIEGIDICACCAPHVARTGEVGILKVLDVTNHKQGVRISILCGMRALTDYKEKHESLSSLSHTLSVPIPEVPDALAKVRAAFDEQVLYIRELETKLLEHAIAKADTAFPVIFCQVSDSILLRNTVNELTEKADSHAIAFNGNDKSGYSFIIASKKDDARDIMHRLSESVELKGGGSDKMVQGKTGAGAAALREAIAQISAS